MKTLKTILKISGYVMIVAGVACLVAGYMEQIKALNPFKKKKELITEYADYADVE